MQRLALLPIALGRSPPDPDEIYEAMKDKVFSDSQPYSWTITEIPSSYTSLIEKV